jgi:hypothetical protein
VTPPACAVGNDWQVIEPVGQGVVGMAFLTADPLVLPPSDARLSLCTPPDPWPRLSSALVQRVTDRSGEVLGVLELLALDDDDEGEGEGEGEGRHGPLRVTSAGAQQAVTSCEDHVASLLRLLRLLQGREGSAVAFLLHQALSSLLTSLPKADKVRLYLPDADQRLLLPAFCPLDEPPSAAPVLLLDGRGVGRCLRHPGPIVAPASSDGAAPEQLWIGLRRPPVSPDVPKHMTERINRPPFPNT